MLPLARESVLLLVYVRIHSHDGMEEEFRLRRAEKGIWDQQAIRRICPHCLAGVQASTVSSVEDLLMIRKRLVCVLLVANSVALIECTYKNIPTTRASQSTADGRKDYAQMLAEADKQIRETPGKPLPYYRRCQALMKLKRYEEGYKVAQEAMSKYIAADDRLAWMLIDTIDLDRFRVDVHFNMGPDERNPPAIGIVRPLSFRVWTREGERRLVNIVDFEIGYYDGKPNTAAFGKTIEDRHVNYGLARPEMSYTEIRESARKLIAEMTDKAQK